VREIDKMKHFGSRVGLPLSVGKVYSHCSYANINSTSFMFDLRSETSTPVQVDYLNVGLLFGQSKVLGGEDVAEDSAYLPHILPQLLRGSLHGCETMYDFLGLHADELRVQTKGRNLFIHPSLGGFGVPVPVGWQFDVTTPQIAEAQRILRGLPNHESAQLPASSRVVQREEKTVVHSPWRDLSVTTSVEKLRKVTNVDRNLSQSQLTQLLVGVKEIAPISRFDYHEEDFSYDIQWNSVSASFQAENSQRSGERAFSGLVTARHPWSCDCEHCN